MLRGLTSRQNSRTAFRMVVLPVPIFPHNQSPLCGSSCAGCITHQLNSASSIGFMCGVTLYSGQNSLALCIKRHFRSHTTWGFDKSAVRIDCCCGSLIALSISPAFILIDFIKYPFVSKTIPIAYLYAVSVSPS